MARRLITRRGRSALVVAGVLFGHWLLLDSVANHLASRTIDAAMAPRLTAVYVRQLALAEPPPAPTLAPLVAAVEPTPRISKRPASAVSPLAAASQPAVETATIDTAATTPPSPAPEPIAEPAVRLPHEPAALAAADVAVATEAPSVDDEADAPAFAWPASTRLNYVLTGNYRGEVHGSAQVEWINAEPRYQVNLDVTIGLPFAPLLSRQMRSDGLLGTDGLQPVRYDQRSKMAFQEPRATSLRFRDRQVSTEQGRPLPLPPAGQVFPAAADFEMAVQDSASQFVQLTWLFTTRPQLLVPGTTISFPLALPGRVADWRYQVGPAQTLFTRFGQLEAYRVHTAPGTDRRRDLLAEAWFAPQLAYLPVRIRIEQDANVYLDLMIKEKPEIAIP